MRRALVVFGNSALHRAMD